MKKIGFIIFITALFLGVLFANLFSFGRASTDLFNFSFNRKIEGSGRSGAEDRNISNFKAVDVGGIFEVEITAQKNFSVEVQADDNLLEFITTEVCDNGVLKIRTEKRIKTQTPIRIIVSAPDIESLEVSGAGKVSLWNLKNSAFNLNSSGASKILLKGETASLAVDSSGATQIDAEGLKTGFAKIEGSGASQISVLVSEKLIADLSGASKVFYSGNPKSIIKETSGSSSVSAK